MDLDAVACYRAVRSRDPRFDGRFFTGVISTGVYCRPICPAPTPKPAHVRFFACAAAAEAAGFRACRRCRPDTAPGTPAWVGAPILVTRGLRLILGGALDAGSVEDLAARLGVGSRYLRRLFIEHLGASPNAIALTRRVHFARTLIDQTDLSMTAIACAAAFPSVRRFNASVRRTFGKTPTALRGERRRPHAAGPAPVVLRLPFRPPLAWDACLRFLEARATPGVETVRHGVYRRTVSLDGAVGWIDVSRADTQPALVLTAHLSAPAAIGRVADRVRRMFDLAANPADIEAHFARDPRIAPLLAVMGGIRIPGAWDGFELAVRTVLGQQVTVKAATTLAGRLADRCGERVGAAPDDLSALFPTPAALARADLAGLGLTAARARTIRCLAEAVRDGRLSLDATAEIGATTAALQAIPGAGPWTAQYIALRALGDPDAFPASDLGVRRALSPAGRLISPRAAEARAASWRPWRGYAAMLLWMTGAARIRDQPRRGAAAGWNQM